VPVLGFGRFELLPERRRLLKDGEPIAIGARAFDVLLALAERRERVVTKAELLDIAWPDLVVEENNLQVQISSLRKLLGSEAITTIPGRGYRFTAALHAEPQSPRADARATAPQPPAPPGSLAPGGPELLGRDDELRTLRSLVTERALVTIVGPAGTGKTVLAMAVARALRPAFGDGAWIVELAAVSDPAHVVQAVAHALKIAASGPRPPQQEEIVARLAAQNLLLVLDNCEHLVDAAGRLAAAVATRAPGLRVLATSQERLSVPGETLFRLGPLQTPPVGHRGAIGDFSAVRLFVERARGVQQNFALTAANSDAVAEICHHLDGMPLAIELAAARVCLLGVHGLRDHLNSRFKLLVGGARTAAPRQQTLEGAMAWSHALLSTDEQAVLRRMSVFVGGFSLELARQVAADHKLDKWAVLDALSGLVDKSLVAANATDPPRYRLLETTRAYALERLAERGEKDLIQGRHAAAVRDLFVSTEEARFGESGSLTMDEFLERLAPEIENLRVAFDFAVKVDIETAIALAASSTMLLRLLGLSQEAAARILPLRHEVRSRTDSSATAIFWSVIPYLGDFGRMPRSEVTEAVARATSACRAAGYRRRLHRSLSSLTWSVMGRADELDRATAICAEMQKLELPTDPPWVPAMRLNVQANIVMWQGQFAPAVTLLEEQRTLLLSAPGEEVSLIACENNLCAVLNCLCRFDEVVALARSTREHVGAGRVATLGYTMVQLLHAQILLGELDDATRTLREEMPGWRRDGLVLFGCTHFAALLAAKGQYADAARLDGAAMAAERRNEWPPSPVRQRARQYLLELLAAANVDGDDIAFWREEGRALDEAAIAALCLRI
jgi:predicted ATPase/DNA-binding winged helix-turn-helix (wHTH) protein